MSESLSPLSKKSNGEQITLVALYNRAIVSKSILISFKKRGMPVIFSLFEQIPHKKQAICFVLYAFDSCSQFFPLFMLKKEYLQSLFAQLLFFEE